VSTNLALRVYTSILLLSLSGYLFQFTKPVASASIWIVHDDGPADFHAIQEAIDAASPGDTISVRGGIYHENVVVSKTLCLIGEDKEKTIVDGRGGDFAFKVRANSVVIKGFTIQNSWAGIYMEESFNCSVLGNDIVNNVVGARISKSSNNSFYHNNFINNSTAHQIVTDFSSINFWDDGYTSGGNYWNRHNPLDEDLDKIGDQPYIVDENNTDRYPLVYPFQFYEPDCVLNPDLNRDGTVNVVDLTMGTISFGSRPGDLNCNPKVDIDINEIINILDVARIANSWSTSNNTTLPKKCELSVWGVYSTTYIPPGATWGVVKDPNSIPSNTNITLIMDWYDLHPPWGPYNPYKTTEDLKTVEDGLKRIPSNVLWGIIGGAGPCHEHYKEHIQLNDNVDTTWFGEKLTSYSLFLRENSRATQDQWRDEMYLRMCRGFYNYFHSIGIKVGQSIEIETLVYGLRNRTFPKGYTTYFGEPAFAFIRENYYFIVAYGYTRNLEDFQQWIKPGFLLIDQYFPKQKKFWILTRIWQGENDQTWEPEAMALEIKNCLDRKMIILLYSSNNPAFNEVWRVLLKGIELYNSGTAYFEEYVYGKNLLTGYEGSTYGWVGI
jgi:parallel beta-helix repeat protein